MNVLAVDIGGTHLKFRTQRHKDAVKVKSGKKMTPEAMMAAIHDNAADWKYEAVSIGYPGPVVHDTPIIDPYNLAPGWVKFDFKKAFDHRPLRLMNDAAMQALGSYEGGRMLFLGLGTGLGSALVVEGVVQAMEIAHLPWKKGKTYEDLLGAAALEKNGKKSWLKSVLAAIEELETTLESEYVVLGGGNAKLVSRRPRHVVLGSNENAFEGGFKLWKAPHHHSR